MSDFYAQFEAAKLDAEHSGRWDALRKLEPNVDDVIEAVNRDRKNIKQILLIKKLPFDALDYLARIGDESDKRAICAKYPLNRSTYEFLASQNDEIKVALFSNKKLPKDINERLLNDPSEWVRAETKEWVEWTRKKDRLK